MNKLINGKAGITRIVSIEPTDDGIEVFQQHEDGFVSSTILPNEYWILADKCLDQHFKPLKGNLTYKWIKTYKSRKMFSSDRYRFKSEETFSIWNPKEAAMVRDGLVYFKDLKHTEVGVLAFDIETTGLTHDSDSKLLIISNTFSHMGKVERKMFTYDEYDNEGEMLQAWCEWVREKDPSILLGHNILLYDIPYMRFIANKWGVDLILGRNDTALTVDTYESQFRKDGANFYTYNKVHVYGREVIDTLFLAYKYDIGRKYENYGLKTIIRQEGLEITNRPFYDANKIRFNYKDPAEWQKIKAYAEQDGDDALNLYMLACPPFFYMTQSIARSYQHVIESATGGQINSMMNRAYLQDGHSLPKVSQSMPFEGAISFGTSGIYSNVNKIDLISLYPSIMIEYDVYSKDKDPNKYFPQLVKTFTDKRIEYKKLAKTDKYYDDLQASFKILANSCYGFLGSQFNNFNYQAGAAFVTETGRNILEFTIDWAKEKGFIIANGDTDSISFCYPDYREMTEEERDNLLNEINEKLPGRIKFAPDGYFKRMVVLKAKNYILYDGKKITYKGSGIKATGKEPALKEFIKELLNEILDGKLDFVPLYEKYVKEIMNITDITRWCTKKTISKAVLTSERSNERIVREAIAGTDYVEGDKPYFFYQTYDKLSLQEHFNGEYDKKRLLEKLHDTACTFETIIDKKTFINYGLKRSKEALDTLIKN